MKIAILSNAFPPDGRGGAERIAALQADVLFEREHEIAVWAPDSDAARSEEGSSGSDTIHRFSSAFDKIATFGLFRRLAFHFSDRGVNHHVAHQILDWKPDVLMTHNLTGCGIGTPSYLQSRGVCWIHTLHDVQLFEPSGKMRADRKAFFYETIWRKIWATIRRGTFGVPNVLVSPSAWLLHMHEHYGFRGKKMVILPNPMDVSSDDLGHTMHQPSTLAFVGRLSMDKGVDIFADVCRHLIRQGVVNRVLIAGDGPDRSMLPTDPMIDLRGAVSFEEAHSIIAEADLLIAPSRLAENQPTTILEAMAEGTPVIASDAHGARELLMGTDAPLIPWTGDVAAEFTKAAVSLLSDPKRWHEISHAMHDRARARHEAEFYADNLIHLIETCER